MSVESLVQEMLSPSVEARTAALGALSRRWRSGLLRSICSSVLLRRIEYHWPAPPLEKGGLALGLPSSESIVDCEAVRASRRALSSSAEDSRVGVARVLSSPGESANPER